MHFGTFWNSEGNRSIILSEDWGSRGTGTKLEQWCLYEAEGYASTILADPRGLLHFSLYSKWYHE